MRLTPEPALAERQSTYRRLAEELVAPLAAEHDRTERVDRVLFEKLAVEGCLAPLLPERYGGQALDPLAYGLLHEELGRACSATRSLLTVHDMVADTIRRWGSAGQREHWLPRLASGERLAAFALSEPGAGSDAAAVTATAEAVEGGWELTGTKKWISFGQLADLYLVFARTQRGVSALLVERDTPGLTVAPITGMLGTRGAMLAELCFEGCRLPAEALVGPEGRAHPYLTVSSLTLGRYSVAAGSIGIVQGCLEAAAAHAAERGVIAHQLVQRMLADMVVAARAGRLLTLRAGELIGAGSPDAPMAATEAKYFASVAAGNAARDAVQVLGALGCSAESPVARYFRDAKVMEVIEGSNEISQTTIGRFGHAGAGGGLR
ncbi:acyl-CoA dehydrogenase [Kitasatospora sp. MMS16-BH015]|uniref:acyl-CoA dehydrogenase family protein n=1 Tax=Kitasatospora sp. MMS16-BH015 TaxID=2018025 RepID=UPI000CA3C687|nr:acyl-CoA dehydrogenase family protein [Kitasatospora sp. MMS16-BH015]AUG75705.1 acyl-CoA dehydrogenase [Kitasatospora sp. MMS16-BH015]